MMERPDTDSSLLQQFCMPETSRKRACRIAETLPEGGKILVLGDDDLVSLALAAFGKFEIHVAELDPRLVSLIEGTAKNHRFPITVHHVDSRHPLPEPLRGRFSCVTTDPPYTSDGMPCFLIRAREALDSGLAECRLFLSTDPLILDDPAQFEWDAAAQGFICLRHEEHFNLYFSDRQWNQIIRSLLEEWDYPLNVLTEMNIAYIYADFFEMGIVKSLDFSSPIGRRG